MWKLKVDGNGVAVLQEGKPVYIDAEGKEHVFDIAGNQSRINGLNSEARTFRERAEAAELKLKGYEGIADPAAARKALETVAKLDEKQLIAAGDRDAAVRAAVDAVEAKYKPIVAEHQALGNKLNDLLIGGAFAGSKFVTEKFAAAKTDPQAAVAIAKALFASSFKVENGELVAYDNAGNKIYSPVNHGKPATADEAIEFLVNSYPHKASLLVGSGHSGGGMQPGGGGGSGGKPTYTRQQFNALPPAEQAKAATEAVITD